MARSASEAKMEKEPGRKPGRPVKRENVGRGRASLRTVEELKLGKFAVCEPLRLPEKEIRRGWQITGAVVLILVAIVGLYAMFMLDPIRVWTWDNDGFVGGRIEALMPYEWVLTLMLAVSVVMCVTAAAILLAKKKVPAELWYVLIGAVTVGLLCASFHAFKWFEERDCYENYPGVHPEDPSKGSGCPSVEKDLIVISVRNLVIYTLGIVAFCWVRRKMARRARRRR